jgi:membrane protein implicated in regulation of membrane protease activity
MNWPNVFLFCFAVGGLWAVATVLLGGLHLGHLGSGHGAGHGGHLGHPGGHSAGHPGDLGHAAGQGGHAIGTGKIARAASQGSWAGSMANPSCIAVFLAWFGGIGYLLTRHSGLAFWLDVLLALVTGLAGAWILAAFLRFLQSREQPLDPLDYEMVGVLGQVASAIRPDGVGELIYVREGTRRALPARSEDAQAIARGEEVIVTRYDKGIAYVRTWEAMTRPDRAAVRPSGEALQKEMNNGK